ncbi:IclR family transcriptional regulator [Marinobacterium sedimentorum]|uniref:IclR family transcriptional regulator n=1 Tax=Marinobacterium sedimentorum TaxID=2927804 RepID=UPI0020C6A4EB|nr:IclR family transcriptional regulator [Marinobacterium sedimentorum]MCP8689493.1 IclR family transcriptional regulator [Marinobacterium sedimentorum]
MSTTKCDAKPQVQGTAAFSKFINVLEAISDTPEIDIAQLCKRVSYPRSTIYRLTAALVAEGLIAEDKHKGAFTLGPRLISLAKSALEQQDLRLVAQRYLIDLRDKTGETIHLAIYNGAEMTFIDKIESPQAVRMVSRIGTRIQLHSTAVGKAYLATLSTAECEKILDRLDLTPQTEHTITDFPTFRRELDLCRQRGYAIGDEENEAEIRCFGAAITDSDGEPVGAISVSTPKYRYSDNEFEKITTLLLETVRAISTQL